MCQAFEGEQRSVFLGERAERRRKWKLHESGEKVLTDEELRDLAIEEIMARDAGY